MTSLDSPRTLVPALAAAMLVNMLSAVPVHAAHESFEPTLGQSGKDVMWLPTPDALIDRLLKMAALKPDDTLVDLGSGDGKIVLAAVRDFGARGRGVEYDARLVTLANETAARQGLASRARFVQGDIFKSDFSDADVVAMYLLPQLNLKLRPTLLGMRPGTRIVTHWFDMGDWQPDERTVVDNRPGYLWVVPANAGGEWSVDSGPAAGAGIDRLTITQRFQRVQATLTLGEMTTSAIAPRLVGDQLTFQFTDAQGVRQQVRARIADSRMTLTVKAADGSGASGKAKPPLTAIRHGETPVLAGSEPAGEAEMARAAAVLGAD